MATGLFGKDLLITARMDLNLLISPVLHGLSPGKSTMTVIFMEQSAGLQMPHTLLQGRIMSIPIQPALWYQEMMLQTQLFLAAEPVSS